MRQTNANGFFGIFEPVFFHTSLNVSLENILLLRLLFSISEYFIVLTLIESSLELWRRKKCFKQIYQKEIKKLQTENSQ